MSSLLSGLLDWMSMSVTGGSMLRWQPCTHGENISVGDGDDLTMPCFKQVSSVADGPARRATSRASCCTQTKMLRVINWPRSSVERRPLQVFCQLSSTDDDRQFITPNVYLCRTKLTTFATTDVPWPNLQSSQFRTEFQRKVSVFLEVLEFP